MNDDFSKIILPIKRFIVSNIIFKYYDFMRNKNYSYNKMFCFYKNINYIVQYI